MRGEENPSRDNRRSQRLTTPWLSGSRGKSSTTRCQILPFGVHIEPLGQVPKATEDLKVIVMAAKPDNLPRSLPYNFVCSCI
jgi:hypothetical protein